MNNKRIKWNIEKARNFYKKHKLELLEEKYINNSIPMKCKNIDGYLCQISLGNLQSGQTPFPFIKSNPYTIYNIKKFLKDNNANLELLSTEYMDNSTPLKLKCRCGNIFYRPLARVKDKKLFLCEKCGRKNNINAQRLIYDKVEELYKKYRLSILPNQKYINNMSVLTCVDKDGYIVKISYNNLSKGKQPNKFSLSHNKENYDYNVRQFIKNNNLSCEYLKVISYDGYGHPVLLMRCECGDLFTTEQHDLTTRLRHRCLKCVGKMSNIEYKVKQWLLNNNIEFEEQKQFKECKGKKKCLPFDFYIPNINMCIEVDGQQHFKDVYSRYKRDNQEEYDNIKTKYCKDNNIKLLRIPYYEFNENDNYINILSNNIL